MLLLLRNIARDDVSNEAKLDTLLCCCEPKLPSKSCRFNIAMHTDVTESKLVYFSYHNMFYNPKGITEYSATCVCIVLEYLTMSLPV